VPEVDLRVLARRALAQAAQKLEGAGVEVVTKFDDDVPKVACSPDPLVEALAHLIDNACNAMKAGGTLTVSVEERDGKLVLLRVRDTGCGIPREQQSRIFEPFYTTRLADRAKGLGLARVYQIVEEHNGKVTVDSEPNAGATFTLRLPVRLSRSIA
jgi:signal transduction histidine kinase